MGTLGRRYFAMLKSLRTAVELRRSMMLGIFAHFQGWRDGFENELKEQKREHSQSLSRSTCAAASSISPLPPSPSRRRHRVPELANTFLIRCEISSLHRHSTCSYSFNGTLFRSIWWDAWINYVISETRNGGRSNGIFIRYSSCMAHIFLHLTRQLTTTTRERFVCCVVSKRNNNKQRGETHKTTK